MITNIDLRFELTIFTSFGEFVFLAGVVGSKPWQTCCLSQCQSTGSLVARVDSRTQESCREDATVCPGLGQFDPYVQQLMILILKSTQNLGVTTEYKERRFGRGVSSVLILRLPRHWWSLPLIGEEGDSGMRWRRGSRCPSLGCLALGAERRQMEWNGVSEDRIRILSPLGLTLSHI